MKHELPTKLSFVKVDGSTTCDSPHGTDIVRLAVVEIYLAAKILVPPDQCSRRETQEADRVRHAICLPLLDQGSIKRDSTRTGISSCLRIFLRSFLPGWNG